MNHQFERERGSALLITMIVITVLGSIAFSIGASTIGSFRRQSQIEDSANAYQAAVSGLEDGLLRFRFDKDTETPIDRPTEASDCPADRPTTSSEYYDRINLTTGEVTYCIKPDDTAAPDPSHIVYDLKIQYKKNAGEPEVVDPPATASGDPPALEQDQVVEYDVGSIAKSGAVLKQMILPENNSPQPNDIYEVVQIDKDGNTIDKDNYKFFDIFRMKNPQSLGLKSEATKIRFKYLGQDISKYTLEPPKDTKDNDLAIDSRITEITSKGYFGLAKRSLSLQLDRESGKLLPLFDFALFAENSDIKPSNP